MDNPFQLGGSLAAKLGSIVVHAEEFCEPGGHQFDFEAMRALMADQEVQRWLSSLRSMAMVPVKRFGGR